MLPLRNWEVFQYFLYNEERKSILSHVSKSICDSPLSPTDILVPQDNKKRKSEMIIFYDFTIIHAYRLHCVGTENIKHNVFPHEMGIRNQQTTKLHINLSQTKSMNY
jgi:hypothetical protein